MNIDYRVITNPYKYLAGRNGEPILHIVLHTYDGAGDDLYNWFQNLSPNTSAHYSVSLTGVVRQYVWEANTAYHSGNSLYNLRSIGIEHQDNGQPTSVHRTDAQYNASGQLVYEICKRNNIPIDRSRIVLHREVLGVGNNTAICPGNLDIGRIIKIAQSFEKMEQLQKQVNELQSQLTGVSKSLSDALKTNEQLKADQEFSNGQINDLKKALSDAGTELLQVKELGLQKDKEIERLKKVANQSKFIKLIGPFYILS